MTPERLAEIEARAAKATPGPWVWLIPGGALEQKWSPDRQRPEHIVWPDNVPGQRPHEPRTWAETLGACGDHAEANSESNAAFIAHARADVPALVAEVKRLNNALQSLASHYLKSALDPGDTP